MFALIVVVVIGALVLAKGVVIVPPRQVYIVERLGKRMPPLMAGMHFLVPIVDRVSIRYSMDELPVTVNDSYRSSDGVNVPVEMTARYRILDPVKATDNISDVHSAVRQILDTMVKKEAARRKGDDFKFESRSIESDVVKNANEAAAQFGVMFIDCTLK